MSEEDIETEEVTEEQQSDSIEEGRDWDTEAKAMGYRDDYDGPNKVDAKTFVERGEKHNNILKERLNHTQTKLSSLEKTMEKFREHHEKTEKRAYEKARAEILAEKEAAAENDDLRGYQAADKKLEKLEAEKPQPEEKPQDGPHPDFPGWLNDNSWYESNPDLQDAAEALAPIIAKRNPHLAGRAFFDEVTKQVRKAYPQEFRQKPSVPDVEGVSGSRKAGKKTYSDLPPEAKKMCDEFVQAGLLTKEQYVKEYDWS